MSGGHGGPESGCPEQVDQNAANSGSIYTPIYTLSRLTRGRSGRNEDFDRLGPQVRRPPRNRANYTPWGEQSSSPLRRPPIRHLRGPEKISESELRCSRGTNRIVSPIPPGLASCSPCRNRSPLVKIRPCRPMLQHVWGLSRILPRARHSGRSDPERRQNSHRTQPARPQT